MLKDAPLSEFSDEDAMSLMLVYAAAARHHEAVHKQVHLGVPDNAALETMASLQLHDADPGKTEGLPFDRNLTCVLLTILRIGTLWRGICFAAY